uniref:Retrovirus-related Pol polyprotein from type-1 retrotransposable element R1 n=1 Tax=Talaromyces marneffei PM1 TaxID=1077442 RepID=A0A093ULR6_TALMA
MVDATEEEPATVPAPVTRSGRVITPSTRAREATGSADNTSTAKAPKKAMTQMELTGVKKAANLIEEKQSAKDGSKDLLRKICQYLESTVLEVKGLQESLCKQEKIIKEQSEMIREQSGTIKALQTQVESIQSQSAEEYKQLREQLDNIANTPVKATYAAVVENQPGHQQNEPQGPLGRPTFANVLFCTIDTSRVGEEDKPKAQIAKVRQMIEKEIQAKGEMKNWRCAAVVKDAKNPDRVKVICRHEDEIQLVKEAAPKLNIPGLRVLRDQLYPVKIDNVNRTAVLDTDGNILPGAAEVLGKENNVDIAKISWLSKKDSNKAYGSMVVYITKGIDARRLIEGEYFDIAGESAYTRLFEPRIGLVQSKTVEYASYSLMYKSLRVLQLNVGKRDMIQQSLMNDNKIRDYGAIAISEPYARMIENTLVTSPMGHSYWTKMIPTERQEGRWPIRSMLWVRSDIDAEQIPVASSDLTAAILQLLDRAVLVVSVYVEGSNDEALISTVRQLHNLSVNIRGREGRRTDVLIMGDFNRHDQLWGGDHISSVRQGEADALVDYMAEHSLHSLLPRGIKTWQSGDIETTIDLALASTELAEEMVRCCIHYTNHGSDHQAIETEFDISIPDRSADARLLWKNAPWAEIRSRVATNLQAAPLDGSVQQQTDRLMTAVMEAVMKLTPKAKPSPYAKRWWTTDLTQLRRIYTYQRNQARSQRRAGRAIPELEQRAKEAAKEYHDAIRRQKKAHWEDFLADDTNIWQASRYLKPSGCLFSDKIPPLSKPDGSTTKDNVEQAEELLSIFFPPLPARIEDEGILPQRPPIHMPDLTIEEIERKVFEAKPWKAPGEDGLPAMTSLRDSELPSQWRNAKIIPLKKPAKENYSLAKSWRPISLLSTLGKILEAVIAERISYAVETFGLLPANHFRARKRRSAEQALLLLQEEIYKAWRTKKVFSLVSFDVAGAYNGVFKERLLQRLRARGMPDIIIKWINAFCSRRTATIIVNRLPSEQQDLLQAGLPQGSPLSPILFLFFNADLVQQRISAAGGSIAFVDDYTAWVTGASAEVNHSNIQATIDRALDWERRSGATFEHDKTAIIHFTRTASRSSSTPFMIDGKLIQPKDSAKILGVVMDSRLRFKEHIANAATKGLIAAIALRRLRMKQGAIAVTGAFQTVATTVAEAEASIQPFHIRHMEKATKLWIDIHTLPKSNPLTKLSTFTTQRFTSPLQKIAQSLRTTRTKWIETIQAFTVSPWTGRIQAICEKEGDKAIETATKAIGILAATSASTKSEIVGMGGCMRDTQIDGNRVSSYSTTLGKRTDQNPYTAELEAMAVALECIPTETRGRWISILSSNRSALAAISQPRQQSGQATIQRIYKRTQSLRKQGNAVNAIWIPAYADITLKQQAKAEAQKSTRVEQQPEKQPFQAKSTAIRLALAAIQQEWTLPEHVGKYSKKVDIALLGKHTRSLYDSLNWKEAKILAQLRTGMTRLNSYLNQIGIADSGLCACGQASETVEHFLFRCTKWTAMRDGMNQCTESKRGNLSFFLGGKSRSDRDRWQPDMKAVHAAIKYAIATGRLEPESESEPEATQ